MNISNYYNLGCQQSNLDFVDVRLNTDNLLFVDPRLIENLQTPLAKKMNKHLEVFWGDLIKNVKSKSFDQADYLLSGLSEPNETRLGFAFSKHYGNSVGYKLRQKIAQTIYNNIAVKTGVLSHFSDIELFFEDISSDRISDMTTKIIKSVLIEYTQEQCKLHKIPMKKVYQKDVFDLTTSKWVNKSVELPEYFGKPIIFIPKNIVRLQNSAGKNINCFYRYAIRQFISNDTQMLKDVSASGKEGKILIRDIKSKYPLSKESLSNWSIKFGKLLVDYKTNHLKGRLRVLADDEIAEIVYENGYAQVG
ncbi:hypothetical protein JAO71_03835 [Olleya sp. YSTF-M6]|uniref:Uncharacterized protein n=1 Tax=Olleya sediminilitoris TaxID=2795739 RepID=A0ABS1WII5_9FLAO|nr:hypothetical protein [Olleya sediminilitoris]MBL7558926.1 hypothetical protein [Olleya sediminilitoris]